MCPSSQSLFAARELADTYVDIEAELEAERNQLADREAAMAAREKQASFPIGPGSLPQEPAWRSRAMS
jgi:hypothetical protein